jgi:hypothetical protein
MDRALSDPQPGSEANALIQKTVDKLLAVFDDRLEHERQERCPVSAYEALTRDPRASDKMLGKERLKQFRQLVQSHEPPRSSFQQIFHDICEVPLLPFIYGKKEFNRCYTSILDELDRDCLTIMVLLYFFRRGGKTDGASRCAAALLYVAPDGVKCLACAQVRLSMLIYTEPRNGRCFCGGCPKVLSQSARCCCPCAEKHVACVSRCALGH